LVDVHATDRVGRAEALFVLVGEHPQHHHHRHREAVQYEVAPSGKCPARAAEWRVLGRSPSA